MFRSGDWLESYKGNLHRQNGSNDVQCGIGNIHPMGESSSHHQGKDMEGDDVNQEHVASPRGDLGERIFGYFILLKVKFNK